MAGEPEDRSQAIADRVAGLVCAYVAHNHVPLSDLPALIASVQATFVGMVEGVRRAPGTSGLAVTEAEIRKSITRDALISFIDGKPYKALRRHLTANGIDPQTYRERYGLPANYPMVSASYSARRAEISRTIKPTARSQA